MGQAPMQKAQDATIPPAAIVHSRLQRHAVEIGQIVSITYEEFLSKINELNTM